MCGIAAIISLAKPKPLHEPITRLALSLIHRGDQPPAVKDYFWTALGCARLAIVDDQRGNQPMEVGTLSVVFNGEIYNHADLRTRLEALGVHFFSKCDTEVLLRSYTEWGDNFLDYIEGMYAFVLVDRQTNSFVAARDPFGIKPLYYARDDSAWYFASEIRPLFAIGLPEITPLLPGQIILNGKISVPVRYPELVPVPPQEFPLAIAIRRLREELGASVLRHLPSDDLPIAIFCSGGIDSSAILYEAVQQSKRARRRQNAKLVAYSIGTPGSEDHQLASRLAADLDVPFRFEEISPKQMVESIPLTVQTIESFEPNHIRAGTASIALARRVHGDGFKIALIGEGADELLGGYEEFAKALQSSTIQEVEALLRVFCAQLHRTQLRRVDRSTMAFGIEARVPFLDRALVRLIQKIPTEYKVYRRTDGRIVGKHVLREAYRNILPDYIVDRRKVPMGEGAGIGDNRAAGPFFEHCERIVSDNDFYVLKRKYPTFNLRNKEEAHYFSIFKNHLGPLLFAADRPRTNMLQTT
jgi:asparagine synthase (glutamine-hydrolysing)